MAQVSKRRQNDQLTVIHPALEQRSGLAVGVVDDQGAAWVVQQVTESWQRHDALALYKERRVQPKPYIYSPLRDRWPRANLEDFLARPVAPSIASAVVVIQNFLTEFVEFPAPEYAATVACWIVGTYFHQLFPAFPRLNVHGERGSGKTKLLQLISALAFNGLHRISPTSAVLYRLIEPLRPTFCLDEMEGLDSSEHRAIYSILNAGYKAGAAVDRTEGDGRNRHVESYEVFAPAAFGSIAGVSGALAERCITIPMLRGQDPERINRSVDFHDPRFGLLRGWLYRLALIRTPEVRARLANPRRVVSSGEEILGVIPVVPPCIQGRHRELFTPLFTIGAMVGGEGVDLDLLRVAGHSHRDRESLSEDGRALFHTLELRFASRDQITFYPRDLVDDVSEELGMNPERQKVEPRKVGAWLKRYGFRHARRDGRGFQYCIARVEFRERAKQSGYPLAEDIPVQSADAGPAALAGPTFGEAK